MPIVNNKKYQEKPKQIANGQPQPAQNTQAKTISGKDVQYIGGPKAQAYQPGAAYTQATAALQQIQGQRPGSFASKYQPQVDAILSQIGSRDPWKYSMNEDEAWNQFAKAYEERARRAAEDTRGGMAALSGGFGNSYAAAAGAQAYNNQMNDLMANLPQFQQFDYQRYQNAGQDLYNQLGALQGADATDYSRFRDTVGDWRMDLETALGQENQAYNRDYQQYRDTVGDNRYADETQYSRGRDEIADQRYADETAYQRGRDTIADQRYDQQYADSRADTKWQQDYQTKRDEVADQRYADETAYQRGRDTIADQRYADETSYQRGRDTIADQRYADETAYQRGRDTIADQRYADETAYQRGRDTIADQRYDQQYADSRTDAQWDKDFAMKQWEQGVSSEDRDWAGSYVVSMLSQGQMPSAELLAMAGLSAEDAQKLLKQITTGTPGPGNGDSGGGDGDDKGKNPLPKDTTSKIMQFAQDVAQGKYDNPLDLKKKKAGFNPSTK